MILALEYKKLKRTALLPALFLGAILSSSLPIINFPARSAPFTKLNNKPLDILLNSNWAMIATLNSFLIVLGTCIIYNLEFSNNAIQRMDSLPIRPCSLFINKFILLVISFIVVFLLEGSALYFCGWKWFTVKDNFLGKLLKAIAYCFLLSMPMLSFMTAVSSFCKNMWITLGIGVIGIFSAQILINSAALKCFPFLMPYQLSLEGHLSYDSILCVVTVVETFLFLIAGTIFSNVRRNAA